MTEEEKGEQEVSQDKTESSIADGANSSFEFLAETHGQAKRKKSTAPVVDKQVRQEETSPETMEETGSCGEQLTWTLNGGTLIISGTGGMVTIDLVNRPGMAAGEEITDVVIEEGVTNDGVHMRLLHCTNLNSVIISTNSMTQIGAYAFYNCNGLK